MADSAELGTQFRSSIMQSRPNEENYDPNLIDTAQYTSTKFYFQQRRGRLDLRTLSQIDLDRIVRDVDIDVLQMHLENITFSNLKEEDLRFLTDPQVIKLFRTSQLMIEYLLYAQEQLASNLQQMANRYGSKKRSLAKKRIELAELQESTKHLREEVKTKKNSVTALEHLLKTTSRSRPRRRRQKADVEDLPPIRQSVVQFFVSGPEGLCVEFNERCSCSIFQLMRDVRKAFTLKGNDKRNKYRDRDRDNDYCKNIRLVYHGKILLEEGTLESNNIRPGDTIVAVIDAYGSDDDNSETEINERKLILPLQTQSSITPEVVDLLTRQQDAMKNVAQEMRLGWESAMQTMAANQEKQQKQHEKQQPKGNTNTDHDLIGKMDDRWLKLEKSLKDQMSVQLDEYKELLLKGKVQGQGQGQGTRSNRSGLQVGDLESDTEDLLVTRDEFSGRLRDSFDKMGKIDGEIGLLKNTINKQNIEMEVLRTQLLEGRGVHNTYITQGYQNPPSPVIERPAAILSSASSPPQPVIVIVPVPTVDAHVKPIPAVKPSPKKIAATPPPEKKTKIIFMDAPDSDVPDIVPMAAAAAAAAPVAAAAAAAAPAAPVAAAVVSPVEEIIELPKVAVKEINVTQKSAPVVEISKEDKLIEKEILDDGCVDIIFPFFYNPDLDSLISNSDKNTKFPRIKDSNVTEIEELSLTVRLPKDISIEDLIFELRHYIATETDVPLNKVSLVLDGKIVTMGLDVESERDPLTAARAATLANLGILTTKISIGKPLTDSQLDILISHYEDQQLLGLTPVPSSSRPRSQDHQNFGGQISKNKSNLKNTSGIALSDGTKRRNWDQDSVSIKEENVDDSNDNIKNSKLQIDNKNKGPDFTEDPWGSKQEMSLRKSLSVTLQDLSDREGLTDDELQNKLKTLRRSTENIPENLSTHMREYRGSVTRAMAAAAADSGSEDLYTENDHMGRARASTVTLSLSESAQFKRQNLRNSQDESLVRNSMESSSTKGPGPLRMSLPNNGWGRRSIEMFDESEDDYYDGKNNDEDDDDYLYRSNRRGGNRRRDASDEDSRPMMASLTMLPNEKETDYQKEKEKEKLLIEKEKEKVREREKEKIREREQEKERTKKDKEKEVEKGKEGEKDKQKIHDDAKDHVRESKEEKNDKYENKLEKKKEKVEEADEKREKLKNKEISIENTMKNDIEVKKQSQAQAQSFNDNSLTSAVDMRASHNSDLGSTSGIYEEDVKKSKYKEFMDSADASKIVKKIPFDDDDDEIEVVKGSDKSGYTNKNMILNEKEKVDNKLKNDKNVATSALSNFMKMNNNDNKNKNNDESKNDTIESYNKKNNNNNNTNNNNDNNNNNNNNIKSSNDEVQGFHPYNSDDDDDDDGSLTFNLSHNNSGNLTGFGSGKPINKSNGGIKESIDFGDTGKTVSDFGGSGSVNIPLAGKGGEKEKEKGRGMMSNDKGTLGESKNDLTRFDFDRTIDSEGEMVRGRDVPMSQVLQRADALQKQYSGQGSDFDGKNVRKEISKDSIMKSSPALSSSSLKNSEIGAQGPRSHFTPSPMSRGSSMNSGLFDNLNMNEDDDVIEYLDSHGDDDDDYYRNKEKEKEKGKYKDKDKDKYYGDGSNISIDSRSIGGDGSKGSKRGKDDKDNSNSLALSDSVGDGNDDSVSVFLPSRESSR